MWAPKDGVEVAPCLAAGCRVVAGSICCWSGEHLLTQAECREGLTKAVWGKKHLMVSKKRKPNGTCLGLALLH